MAAQEVSAANTVTKSFPTFPTSEQLVEIAYTKAAEYKNAQPFPHIVLDNFFPLELVNQLAEQFPPFKTFQFRGLHKPFQWKKVGYENPNELAPAIANFLYQLNSKAMLEFLRCLTGIEGLITDPYFLGGGLHQVYPEGFLEVHTDFNVHPVMKTYRRINILLYLNQEWKEEYNGQLELWSTDMTRCERKIAPVFNRLVIFNTTEVSFHGHPAQLACPPNMTRNSLALYYYTMQPGNDLQAVPRSTNWQERPGISYTGATVDHLQSQLHLVNSQLEAAQRQLSERDQTINDLNGQFQNWQQREAELLQQIRELQSWANQMENQLKHKDGSLLNKAKGFIAKK